MSIVAVIFQRILAPSPISFETDIDKPPPDCGDTVHFGLPLPGEGKVYAILKIMPQYPIWKLPFTLPSPCSNLRLTLSQWYNYMGNGKPNY